MEGIHVDRERIHPSHLQLANSTIFFCLGTEDSFVNLNFILTEIEFISGLKSSL